MGFHWNNQVFCINKSFFGATYCTETPPLVWIDTSTFLAKYEQGCSSDYDVAFGSIPDTIYSIHYKLLDPIYYY